MLSFGHKQKRLVDDRFGHHFVIQKIEKGQGLLSEKRGASNTEMPFQTHQNEA